MDSAAHILDESAREPADSEVLFSQPRAWGLDEACIARVLGLRIDRDTWLERELEREG